MLHFFCRGRFSSVSFLCKSQILFAHSRDVDIRFDELRERTARASRIEVDCPDTLLRVNATAQCAAAVNDDCQDFRVRNTRLEAIHQLTARHFRQSLSNRRDDTARDVDDLVLFLIGMQVQRTAETAGTSCDDDVFILCHDAFLLFHVSHMSICCSISLKFFRDHDFVGASSLLSFTPCCFCT